MIGSILSGIGSIIDTGYNIYSSEKNNAWNKDFSERQFQYQQDLNKLIMQREDTAVQRKVKDLQAAGMSKWLVAGQGAGSGGSVSSSGGTASAQSPQLNLQNSINSAIGVYGAVQQVKRTDAETNLINAQTQIELNERKQNIQSSTDLNQAQKNKLIQDLYINQYNLEKSINKGIRTTDNMNSIYNSVEAFSNMLNNELTKSIQGIKNGASNFFNRAKNFYKENFDKDFPGWW